MIKVYQYEISPFCDKIRRSLNWKRQPFETRNVSMAATILTLRRINPLGKVPAIELDGERIGDSTHIARWLEERFPEPSLYPSSPGDRALCHIIEDWADESLYFYEVELRFGRNGEAPRWVEELTRDDNFAMKQIAKLAVPFTLKRTTRSQGTGRKDDALLERELAGHLEAIASRLEAGPWLAGSALTIADIAVFAQLHAIRTTAQGGRVVGRVPAIVAYMDRVDEATGKRA